MAGSAAHPLPVSWVATPEELCALVAELRASEAVALDTEFHRERTYFPRLALVQVATPSAIALVDPLALDLAPLEEVFRDPAIEFVLHASEQDLEILERAVGARPARLFDTQIAAGFLGVAHASLAALAAQFLDARITKSARLSNWMARPLSAEQLAYAADDVAWLIALRDDLCGRLEANGRLSWALEEMESARARRREPVAAESAWLRIRECRTLDSVRARRAAARIAAWREEEARRRDVPVRSLLGDLAIASIARHQPRTAAELMALRGVERRLAGSVVEAVLALVQEAGQEGPTAPESPLVVGPRPDQQPVILVAAALVQARALALGVDPSLLAARDDVASFVLHREGVLAKGWRFEECGRDLARLLDGELHVEVTPEGLVRLVR